MKHIIAEIVASPEFTAAVDIVAIGACVTAFLCDWNLTAALLFSFAFTRVTN